MMELGFDFFSAQLILLSRLGHRDISGQTPVLADEMLLIISRVSQLTQAQEGARKGPSNTGSPTLRSGLILV